MVVESIATKGTLRNKIEGKNKHEGKKTERHEEILFVNADFLRLGQNSPACSTDLI